MGSDSASYYGIGALHNHYISHDEASFLPRSTTSSKHFIATSINPLFIMHTDIT